MALGRDQQEACDQKASRNPRPYALALLWAVIMAPITLLLGAVQPFTNIPFQVLPLVMVGPFVAAALCKLSVPSWFPPDAPRATTALTKKAWIATALSSLVYVLTLVLLATPGYTPFVVHDWPKPIAVAAVCIGFIFGSWCEEVGFRGIMYRALAAKLGPWPSVVINGVFFGLCHLQYFDVGVLPVILFVASAVLLDVIMAALWTGSWTHRVLIAMAIHAVVNISIEATGTDLTQMYPYVVMLAATIVSALCALALGRTFKIGDLLPAKQPRQPLNPPTI